MKIIVRFHSLSFAFGNVEPFYLQAALFDVNKKQRLSEVWHFDGNEDSLVEQTLGLKPHKELVTTARSAIFNISAVDPAIHLVIWVEKVLRGSELDASIEPYFSKALKPKEKEKLQKESVQGLSRLLNYRQPFAWGSIALFSPQGAMASPGKPQDIKLTRAKAEELSELEILDVISKRLQGHRLDKKPMPCECFLSFEQLTDSSLSSLNAIVDPSLLPVRMPSGAHEYTKEIQEFPSDSADLSLSELDHPLDYVNHLYVYPECANFAKLKEANSRNITVSVRLKSNDLDPSHEGLPVIYGKSSGPKFLSSFTCQVMYHKKTPIWCEEIKLALPAKLSPSHHLLFSFSHVNCQSKGKSSSLETELGYAIVPLYIDNKVITDQVHAVPVATNLVANYMDVDADANIKWMEGRKPLFTFRSKLVSSVYTQDENLNDFFHRFEINNDSAPLVSSINRLRQVDQLSHARFFPLVLNKLTRLVSSNAECAAREAFLSMLSVLTSVGSLANQSSRSRFLDNYVRFVFDNFADCAVPPFEAFCRVWTMIIDENHPDTSKTFTWSWFFFDLIIKSLTLHLSRLNLLNAKNREANVTARFFRDLEILIDRLASQVAPLHQTTLGNSVPLFLLDLLSLIDRGICFKLIFNYLDRLGQYKDRLQALKVISDHEHFMQLNYPVILPNMGSVTEATIVTFWQRHFLSGSLLHEVNLALNSGSTPHRQDTLQVLLRVLRKADLHPLYQDPESKQRLATTFFPLILIAIERYPQLKSVSVEEKQKWALAVGYVIKNSFKERALCQWWRGDTQKNHVGFMNLLQLVVKVVEGDHLGREISFTVLDILEDFVHDMKEELQYENGRLMQAFFPVFVHLLKRPQTVSFLSAAFRSVRRFVLYFKDVLFVHTNTSYCGDLCYEILRLCNSKHPVTRSSAGSLLYLIIKKNYESRGNFARTKLQNTIAVSKLCGEGQLTVYADLKSTLEEMARRAQKEDGAQEGLGAQVQQMTERLLKVIRDSINIAEFSYDPEIIADLTYRVSVGYRESPVLRVTWLENLVKFHRDQRNFEEVAQCKFLIAAMIVDCLHLQLLQSDPSSSSSSSPSPSPSSSSSSPLLGIPRSLAEFESVCPNIRLEPSLPDDQGSDSEGLYASKVFSEAGLMETLEHAIKFLKMSERYETCIDVYNLLLEIYQSHRDYQKLAVCFRDLKSVCDALVASDQAYSRIYCNYYRVGFYGSKWAELDRQEFIYKESNYVRLSEFSQRLIAQYQHLGEIKMLSNSVDPLKEGGELSMQIVSVEPYFYGDDGYPRKTEWDRNFNIRNFIYETPFTTTGKAHGDMSEQCKRKTILKCELAFPYAKKRIRIEAKEEIVLSPIETANEVLETRAKALRRELDLNPPNIKTLQINLQGAVLAQVNAGPIEIARLFLGENSVKYDSKHVEVLAVNILEFVNVCDFALKLNKQLIGPELLDFQNACEDGYVKLKAEIERFLTATPSLSILQ